MTTSKRNFRFVLWTGAIVGVTVLFLAHPLLLGLPGRLGDIQFERSLRVGMSRAEVGTVVMRTGGRYGFDDFHKEPKSGPLEIVYVDWGTICIAGGKTYHLEFDRDDRLRSWQAEGWTDGC